MWCIHKVCCFQFLTLVLFAWTILDIVKASQNDTVKAIDAVAGNNTIQHINCTNGIQLNGQLFDVADNDTDDSEIEIPLSEQLFEFAQLFSLECLKSDQGNVITSPLSVSVALNLLLQATNGTTLDELLAGLHLSDDKKTLADEFPEYLSALRSHIGSSAALSIANQIYLQNQYQLNSNFKTVIAQQFQSGIETVNFSESKASAAKINQFVEKQTNGKIKNFIAPDQLDSTTRALLVNAIHFKGQWQQPFNKSKTVQGKFYLNETETVPVDFMTATEYFHSANLIALNARALELKYANSNYTFMIILPDNRTGLADLESKLKYVHLGDVSAQMSFDELEITIPKFAIEYEVKLNDVLKNLGINKIFTPDAELSGLLDSNEPLYVSDVIHKAFIELNEEGSEAGAATGIGAVYYSLNFEPEFRADHPFVYYIREAVTNTIVFSGRFQQPV